MHMKTYDFKFYRFGDKKPPDGSIIMFIDEEMFYGSYEFKMGEVEYMWEEFDEEGSSVSFYGEVDDPDNLPPNIFLVVNVNGHEVKADEFLWAPCEEIEKVLDQRDEDEKAVDSSRKGE
jgi:hypothetical protein